jgi:hypothetical protein
MFPVAGIESLAGGDTGSEPYKGKKGQERWQKMRENVIRGWEAEQGKWCECRRLPHTLNMLYSEEGRCSDRTGRDDA